MVKEMNPQITQINTEKRRDERTHAIIGAAMAVHRHLGHGFLEATGLELGVLLNFGAPSLEFQRLVFSSPNLRPSAQSAD